MRIIQLSGLDFHSIFNMLKFLSLFLLISCATVSHQLGQENRQHEISLNELDSQEKILNDGFSASLTKEIYPQDYLKYENCNVKSTPGLCEKLYWELNYKYWFYVTKFINNEHVETACSQNEETKTLCHNYQTKSTILVSLERNYIDSERTKLTDTIAKNKVLIAEDESRAQFAQVVAVVATVAAVAIISSKNQGGNGYSGGGWSSCYADDVWVNGYYRRDGVYVKGHCRSRANGLCYDNYSTVGNVNPYTGESGYKTCN